MGGAEQEKRRLTLRLRKRRDLVDFASRRIRERAAAVTFLNRA
jgi:hypothetical protein